MKNIFFVLFMLTLTQSWAQKKGEYVFKTSDTNEEVSLKVKGTYLGMRMESAGTNNDLYLEKVDALNHKYKVVDLQRQNQNKFDGMNVYLINEAALAINDLKVRSNTGNAKDKLPVFVTLKNLTKDKIKYRIYLASKGEYSKNEYGIENQGEVETLDVYFPTKAQAEAFIEDIRSKGFK